MSHQPPDRRFFSPLIVVSSGEKKSSKLSARRKGKKKRTCHHHPEEVSHKTAISSCAWKIAIWCSTELPPQPQMCFQSTTPNFVHVLELQGWLHLRLDDWFVTRRGKDSWHSNHTFLRLIVFYALFIEKQFRRGRKITKHGNIFQPGKPQKFTLNQMLLSASQRKCSIMWKLIDGDFSGWRDAENVGGEKSFLVVTRRKLKVALVRRHWTSRGWG